MSIISVVYVPEGIAMASDSRLTGYKQLNEGLVQCFTISDNCQKLFLLKKSKIGISSCGDAIIDGKTIADFLRLFEIEKISEGDNVHIISNKLQEYLDKSSATEFTIFFLSGYVGDDAFVYSVTRNGISCLRSGTNYGANWQGEYEAISKLLKGDTPTQFEWNLMPLKDGIDLAEFLVELTIKYQRFEDRIATCGGSIDVLVLTKDYTKFVKHKILTT